MTRADRPARPATAARARHHERSPVGGGVRSAFNASLRHPSRWVVALLLVHALLVGYGIARNSVTYDENYHLPSGVLIAARHDYRISSVNPPLIKALCALPALAVGARMPADSAIASLNQQQVGYSFMRENADHFHRIFVAARMVVLALSLLLGLLIWRFASRLYGARGGLLALAFYAFSPEALAHAGVVGMDLATGLGFLATLYGWWGFTRSGRWGWWGVAAGGFAFTVLTRFTAGSLLPMLATVTVVSMWRGRLVRPRRLWLGLVLLVPVALLALQVGYLGQTSWAPIATVEWHSQRMHSLARAAPWLRLPLPDMYLHGLDWQSYESDSHSVPTFIFGRLTTEAVWWYFPVALLVKWPLGFLIALGCRATTAASRGGRRRREIAFLLLPAALFLLAGMTLVRLNAGVRYMFPLLPLLCVWLGGLALAPRAAGTQTEARASRVPALAVALMAVLAIEAISCAPWYLSFFNRLAGGPGRGDEIVNDSNVDWGQGLIALRDEMRRRGISRVYLTYHGSVDPAIYGIDYIPYAGGAPGGDVRWLAVSSFFYNGLSQRMVTSAGISRPLQVDFCALWERPPVARPANCMYLYPLGVSAPGSGTP